MAMSTKSFFAGIGTTFVILAVGFGGGLIMANSAFKEPAGYQTRAARSDGLTPVRVILPTSAEAAQPPQLPAASLEPIAQPTPLPVQQAADKSDTGTLEAEQRERDRRSAERKARRQAEARARQQREQRLNREQNTPVMAFGGDSSSRGGLFGN
jgi:hypothetical protein